MLDRVLQGVALIVSVSLAHGSVFVNIRYAIKDVKNVYKTKHE